MADTAREVCGSVMMEGKNPKNVWWNVVVNWELEMRFQKIEKRNVKRYIQGQKGGK